MGWIQPHNSLASTTFLLFISISLVPGGQIVRSALDVVSRAGEKRKKILPIPAGHYLAHATWYTASLHRSKGASLVHVQLDVQQEPQCFSARLPASWAGQAVSVLPLVPQRMDG